MDKHWNQYCTMSIVHFMAFPKTMGGEGPIAESVAVIAEDPFFGAVEITTVKDDAERQAVRNVLKTSHIQVGYGAQPVVLMGKLNLNSLDEAERKRAVETLKPKIDEAAEFGCQRLAFLSGKDPGEKDRKPALEALVRSTKELSGYAREKGLALTCETFDYDVDKAALIGPSDLAAKYAEEVKRDYPEFGLMYDLSHQPLLREQSEPALRLLEKHLVHIHVGNAVTDAATPGYGDQHPRFGWPGAANEVPDVVEFIRAMFKVGYLAEGKSPKPWVGFEVKPQSGDESSHQIIAGTKRVWEEAWWQA